MCGIVKQEPRKLSDSRLPGLSWALNEMIYFQSMTSAIGKYEASERCCRRESVEMESGADVIQPFATQCGTL
jgi:hypothetical protein